MSTHATITSWGIAIPGREAQGLAVFMEAIEYCTGLQQQGKVARFATYVSGDGNLSNSGGYMVLEGTADQLRAVEEAEAYQRILLKATLIVTNVEIQHFYTGEALGQRVQLLQSIRTAMGIE